MPWAIACSAPKPPPSLPSSPRAPAASAVHAPASLPPTSLPPSLIASPEAPPSPTIPTHFESDFCPDGWDALSESLCYFVPEQITSPASVVFFAHGILAPDANITSTQTMLRASARAFGFALIIPRGQHGICPAWNPSFADAYCWPTRRESVDEAAASILDEWKAAQDAVERISGNHFERRYVLGFSNGGYFASYVALEGLLRVDGVGVVGAGRFEIDESLFPDAHPPIYLAVGQSELRATQRSAANLYQVLSLQHWPVEYVSHPQRGHEIRADDVEAAWMFWNRSDR